MYNTSNYIQCSIIYIYNNYRTSGSTTGLLYTSYILYCNLLIDIDIQYTYTYTSSVYVLYTTTGRLGRPLVINSY